MFLMGTPSTLFHLSLLHDIISSGSTIIKHLDDRMPLATDMLFIIFINSHNQSQLHLHQFVHAKYVIDFMHHISPDRPLLRDYSSSVTTPLIKWGTVWLLHLSFAWRPTRLRHLPHSLLYTLDAEQPCTIRRQDCADHGVYGSPT